MFGRGLISSVGYITSLYFLVHSFFMENKRRKICRKVFIILCFIISLLGIIAWINVTYTFLSYNYMIGTLINLKEYTTSSMEEVLWRKKFLWINFNDYSFPYSLGLVLTGSYAYDFLDSLF